MTAPTDNKPSRLQLVKSGNFETLPSQDGDIRHVKVENLQVDPNQPRKNLGDLTELIASIKEHGLLQPVVAKSLDGIRYQVIAGERRFTAAKRAGLAMVPCIVRTATEQQTIELQLIENLHRKELDPFEEAAGYRRLKDEHNYTDEQLAKKMSKSRTHITQMLSLLKVPEPVRERCQSSDTPLSRDTLYLIAKQPNEERMLEVIGDAVARVPHEDRRARARVGAPRTSSAPHKPKWTHTSPDQEATVIVQSHNLELTKDRRVKALKDALRQARRSHE